MKRFQNSLSAPLLWSYNYNKHRWSLSNRDLKAPKPPPSDKEKEAIEFLRNDSWARIFFISKIAAPVLNKMVDCGMIP